MNTIIDTIKDYEVPVIVEFQEESLAELGLMLFITATLIFLSFFIIKQRLG